MNEEQAKELVIVMDRIAQALERLAFGSETASRPGLPQIMQALVREVKRR